MPIFSLHHIPFVTALHGSTVNKNSTKTGLIILHSVLFPPSVRILFSVESKWSDQFCQPSWGAILKKTEKSSVTYSILLLLADV